MSVFVGGNGDDEGIERIERKRMSWLEPNSGYQDGGKEKEQPSYKQSESELWLLLFTNRFMSLH